MVPGVMEAGDRCISLQLGAWELYFSCRSTLWQSTTVPGKDSDFLKLKLEKFLLSVLMGPALMVVLAVGRPSLQLVSFSFYRAEVK